MTDKFFLYLNSLLTIARKEVVRVFRIWPQTLLPPVITQTLYFVIFGSFIGSRIQGEFNGVNYISFIVPGLVMMAIIQNSFQNVVSSFYGAKMQKSIEELLVSPTPSWVILAGYIIGGMVRGILIGAIVLIISIFFTRPEIQHFEYIITFAILTSSLFALAGFFNSLFAKSFDDISIIPTFVLTPLTYLGGVFYSIKQLPSFWQGVSRFNPIVYMIDGFRYGFYSTNEFSIVLSLAILLALNGVLIYLNWYLLEKGYGLRA
jgi:ABC-2 type transport system permease protein